MLKIKHEVRDPIHVFINFDNDEKNVLNSWPFQRLRYINQLGPTYFVYPGATHKRFEHSLGVMELAGRVFDIVTREENLEYVKNTIPEVKQKDQKNYWRKVIRMAGLCHDLGHLPFSHVSEKLMPDGVTHETLTRKIITEELQDIWKIMRPKPEPEDIAKIAIGPRKAKGGIFSNWEAILSDIIVGEYFGVDRIDYLLRDSHHTGVAYGKFDHFRLIDTLRILPSPPTRGENGPREPALGVEEGGRHSAEALIIARYFMFTQVYYHHVRRAYDILLQEFLDSWLPGGRYPNDLKKLLTMTDNEVLVEIYKAAKDEGHPGHEPARRIYNREHLTLIYERNPEDGSVNRYAAELIYEGLKKEFGSDKIRFDPIKHEGSIIDFPILGRDDHIGSFQAISDTLARTPILAIDYIFSDSIIKDEVRVWLEENKKSLISPQEEEDEKGS